MKLMHVRSRLGAGLGVFVILAGSGAGAATVHRMALSAASGSGGAQTILQNATSGSAIQGEVASSVNASIKIPFGVLGEYNAAGSTFGIGTVGISTTGYGVGAESLSASHPSLLALNSSGGPGAQIYGENGGDALDIEGLSGGLGLYAFSDQTDAIEAYAQTPSFAAVVGVDIASQAAYGIVGDSNSPGGIGTFGGNSTSGVGLQGMSEANTQGLPAVQAYTTADGTELFDAGVEDSNTGGSLAISTVLSSVSANNSGEVFTNQRASSDLQINGDIYLTGAIYTNCGSNVPYATTPCGDRTLVKQRAPGGASYDMYATKHASETLEDEGEAVLRNGVAHVNLDPSFASVISTRQPYLVFTTPQGDTRGLYVTNRTAQGFDVRETSNGHNSLTFDYRIVAHPFGGESTRMALSKAKTPIAGQGRAKATRAFALHQQLLKHIGNAGLGPHAAKRAKVPASLVSQR